jgi:hypothetical protein
LNLQTENCHFKGELDHNRFSSDKPSQSEISLIRRSKLRCDTPPKVQLRTAVDVTAAR